VGPHRPQRAVPGAALVQLADGRARGLAGAAEIVAVHPDQRQRAVAQDEAVALAGLVDQFPGRLDLGDRVIPFASQEARDRADHLVVGQLPADPEFLADPPAGVERGSGLVEPVELGQDEGSRDVDRETVSRPARGSGRPAARRRR
jgi:hypothetical protein